MPQFQRAEERKVAIAVRAHPTIELLEDRLYVVSCGRAGFQNSRNEVSVVMLKVSLPSDPERKVTTVLEGREYNLRAEVLDHDRKFSQGSMLYASEGRDGKAYAGREVA